MLSLVSDALTAQSGLTDPTDPLLTVRVQIKDGEDPQVFLTPSDGDNGPFTALIARRLKEDPAPKVPGGYIWKVRQYSEVVTLADDKDAARFLFGLFRRDLAPAFEAMEEMVRKLPSSATLQNDVEGGVQVLLRRALEDGTFVSPYSICLSTLCNDCAEAELHIRHGQLGGKIEEQMEAFLTWAKEQGINLLDEVTGDLQSRIHKVAVAPAPKPNEFFLATPLNHGHPFYDLSVQLMNDAGERLLRGRALTVARDFLAKTDAFSAALRDALTKT